MLHSEDLLCDPVLDGDGGNIGIGISRKRKTLCDSSDEETPTTPPRKRTLLCESSDEAEDADSEEEVPMTEQEIEDERIRKKLKKQARQATSSSCRTHRPRPP